MSRQRYGDIHRKRLGVAIGVSIGLHALALALLDLEIPLLEESEPGRALQVVDIPDDWRDAALEVVALETAPEFSAEAAPSGAASLATSASSAPVASAEPGAGGSAAATAALAVAPDMPGIAAGEQQISVAPAAYAGAAQITLTRANRGVIRRAGGSGAAGSSGYDFVAASDAARDAERERGGDGFGGTGGIGVTIFGGHGADCPTPGAVPFIPPIGGLSGIPTGGKGRGVLGRRPPGGEAINRAAPRLGGGR